MPPRDLPILFQAPMVQAIRAARKTVTRRPLKPPLPTQAAVRALAGDGYSLGLVDRGGHLLAQVHGPVWAVRKLMGEHERVATCGWHCPYGRPGHRLWVRETFRAWCTMGNGDYYRVEYRAGGHRDLMIGAELTADDVDRSWKILRNEDKWRPGIHMPRWACRLALDFAEVTVEPLSAITDEGAVREGIYEVAPGRWGVDHNDPDAAASPRERYMRAWASMYGSRPGLRVDDDPWVWAVTFRAT